MDPAGNVCSAPHRRTTAGGRESSIEGANSSVATGSAKPSGRLPLHRGFGDGELRRAIISANAGDGGGENGRSGQGGLLLDKGDVCGVSVEYVAEKPPFKEGNYFQGQIRLVILKLLI